MKCRSFQHWAVSPSNPARRCRRVIFSSGPGERSPPPGGATLAKLARMAPNSTCPLPLAGRRAPAALQPSGPLADPSSPARAASRGQGRHESSRLQEPLPCRAGMVTHEATRYHRGWFSASDAPGGWTSLPATRPSPRTLSPTGSHSTSTAGSTPWRRATSRSRSRLGPSA